MSLVERDMGMDTKILGASIDNLDLCAGLIRAGELVAFPTETVYGLGANALSEASVQKIFLAKGRPSDNPLIVHLGSKNDIEKYATVPPFAAPLIDELMPGAITILLKKKPSIPNIVTGGRSTVGIRIPKNKVALDFLSRCGVPVCAPSANTSTRPSPTTAQHVFDDLKGRIGYILDGGSCKIGIESTIIDLSNEIPTILRRGEISSKTIEQVLKKQVQISDSAAEALCPGLKYKHYSPQAEVLLVGQDADSLARIVDLYKKQTEAGKSCAVLCYNQSIPSLKELPMDACIQAGRDEAEYAVNFYAQLRELDKKGMDTIILEAPKNSAMGEALFNRMLKAAGGRVL